MSIVHVLGIKFTFPSIIRQDIAISGHGYTAAVKVPGKFQIMNLCSHGIDRARSYMNDVIEIFALGGLEPELSPLLYVLTS